MFLGHFCPIGKNPALSDTTIFGPLPEKTYGQTEGWTDGQTLFYRILPVEARGPIKQKKKWLINELLKIS